MNHQPSNAWWSPALTEEEKLSLQVGDRITFRQEDYPFVVTLPAYSSDRGCQVTVGREDVGLIAFYLTSKVYPYSEATAIRLGRTPPPDQAAFGPDALVLKPDEYGRVVNGARFLLMGSEITIIDRTPEQGTLVTLPYDLPTILRPADAATAKMLGRIP